METIPCGCSLTTQTVNIPGPAGSNSNAVYSALSAGNAPTNLTATATPITLGSTPASVTLPEDGTYLIFANLVAYLNDVSNTAGFFIWAEVFLNTVAIDSTLVQIVLPAQSHVFHSVQIVCHPVVITTTAGNTLNFEAAYTGSITNGVIAPASASIFAIKIA